MALRNRLEIRDWSIYTITNPNGRVYVGKTCNITERMRAYRCEKSTVSQPLVHRSFKKYGFENHVFKVIDTFSSNNSYCNGKELFWIRTYMSNRNKYPEQKGMNLTDGGDGTSGFKKSDEEKAAMVLRYTGRKTSEYQKIKASEIHKGNKYNLGRKLSDETKMKISLSNKGRKLKGNALQKSRNSQLKSLGVPVIVHDSITKETIEFTHIKAAALYTGMNRNTVSIHLNNLVLSNPVLKNRRYTFKYK